MWYENAINNLYILNFFRVGGPRVNNVSAKKGGWGGGRDLFSVLLVLSKFNKFEVVIQVVWLNICTDMCDEYLNLWLYLLVICAITRIGNVCYNHSIKYINVNLICNVCT